MERGESFAEVVTPSGRLIESTPTLHGRAVLTAAEAARAARGTITVDRSSAPGLDEPARLLATPFTRDGRPLVLVVGDTRENGLEVLRRVRAQLLVGIPLLVLLTFVGAYAVVGAALRPVEAMRRRASELTADDPALRLPIPPTADEIARLGLTLNSLLARVEQTLERERAFVAHASHELRTPLALLRTQLELAVRRPRPASELEEAIRSAEVEVDRLQRLTEDLLLLAQSADGGARRFIARTSPLAELFADVEPASPPPSPPRAAAGRSGRRRRTVQADRGRLHPGPHEPGRQRARARCRAAYGSTRASATALVDLVVADEGTGFAAEMLDRGTERFVRSPASTGAGLGLAIVAAVAEAHGGSTGLRNVDRAARRRGSPSRAARRQPPQLGQQLSGRHRARLRTSGSGLGHQRLDPRVRRRRYAVQPAEQGDLAVEVVGLDARPARQALPGRAASADGSRDGLEPEVVAAPCVVLGLAHRVDTRGREGALGLALEQVERGPRVRVVELVRRTAPRRRCRGC